MIDFVLVENVLICGLLALFIVCTALGVVYFGASVVEHVSCVRRNIRRLNERG